MIQLALSLAGLLVLASVACATSSSESAGALLLPTALTCADCATVAVIAAIDGDTLDTAAGSLRLFGVDTPEKGQPCYSVAAKRLSQLAASAVRVENGPRLTDPSGRRLFYVYTDAGYNIEAVLIREGLGRAWTSDGQHRGYLMALEESAREQRVGCLWGR